MDLKKLCDKEIYSNKDIPIDIAKDILNFAESGFKEIKTSKKVANLFKSLGQKKIETEIALTGLKTTLDTGKEGPNIAVIGELDGLPVPAARPAPHVLSFTYLALLLSYLVLSDARTPWHPRATSSH